MILIGKLITSQEESRSGYVMGYLDKLIEQKLEQHNQEIYETEKKLAEYKGLISEKQIKIEESYLKLIKRLKLVGMEIFSPCKIRRQYIFPDVLDDWDLYTEGDASWDIDPTFYVSPPSSIKLSIPENSKLYLICKHSDTLNIKEGRIVFNVAGINRDNYANIGISFRNTSPVGSPSIDNTYFILVQWDYYTGDTWIDRTLFGKVINGTRNWLDIFNEVKVTRDKAWSKVRITWWNDPNWNMIVIRWETFDSEKNEWVQGFPDITDPENSFLDSDYARVGVGAEPHGSANYGLFYDDVEVWVPS